MAKQKEKEQFIVSDKRRFTSEGELTDAPSREEAEAPPVAAPGAPIDTPEKPATAAPESLNVFGKTSGSTGGVASSGPEGLASESLGPESHGPEGQEAEPVPPTEAEQKAQHGEYQAASKRIDAMLDQVQGKRPPNLDVNFEGLVVSLYMQAMMQMGMVREESTPPRPDIVGARQTIDTLAVLQEKTKGNLNERESGILQNALFELRMAFLEITNVLSTPPPPEKK